MWSDCIVIMGKRVGSDCIFIMWNSVGKGLYSHIVIMWKRVGG